MRRLYLIRHGKAGNRDRFRGDDRERPLTRAGRLQAELLAGHLGFSDAGKNHQRPSRIVSSPATRCVQTMEPLAEGLGVEVETVEWLAEGSSATGAIDALRRVEAEVVAASTHGDVVWGVLQWLESGGVVDVPFELAKGSTWVLDWPETPVQAQPSRAVYVGPPVGKP